uniref:Uncharacterized protein LOC114345645 n=1 Tax=Diabrotica virgifera virgifera TaxID=50390 RepID=A0A6P7H3G9_DIAVI
MTSFLMVRHFHSKHKDAILDCTSFDFNLNHYLEMTGIYIYQEEDNLFFLYISYSKSENTIKLELVYMGSDELASNIYHQFTVTSENKEFGINCNSKPSSTNEFSVVDVSNMSLVMNVKFKLIYQNFQFFTIPKNVHLPSISNTVQNLSQNLAISKQVLAISKKPNSSLLSINSSLDKPKPNQEKIQLIYKSPLDYTTEIVEFPSEYNPQCFNCKESCIFSLSVSDSDAVEYYHSPTHNDFLCFCCFEWLTYESKINKNHLYVNHSIPSTFRTRFCKWKCGKDFKFSEIASHEILCEKRAKYNCPVQNCGSQNIINPLLNHIESYHRSAPTWSSYYGKSRKVYPSLFKLSTPPLWCYVSLEDQFIIGFQLTTSDNYGMQYTIITYTDNKQSERKPHALFYYDNKLTPLANLPLSSSPTKCTVKIVLVKNE